MRKNVLPAEKIKWEFGGYLVQVKNDLGLLEPLYKALAHDSYTSGGADITPTTWMDSPRIAQLKKG